jgi:hypothetical protein
MFPLFWRNQCVSYSFQPGASKYVPIADAKRIAAQAFDAWSSAPCPGGAPSITALLFPDVDCNDVPSSGHSNVIIFRDSVWPYDDASNAIGFTTLTVDLTTGEILGADTEINSAQWHIVPEPPAPPSSYDFATIMTHEAGHFLGLAHSADASAVMYAKYHPATSLQPDDVAAICSIYGSDGTHNTSNGPIASESCNPAPLSGFLSASCGSFDAGTATFSAIGSGAGVNSGELSTPCPAVNAGCAIGRGSAPEGACLMTGGLVALGAIARLARRSARRRRSAGVALGVTLALVGANAARGRAARASVSAAAIFEDLVKEATAAAVVTATEQRSIWEGNRIVTLTQLRVDRLVSGRLSSSLSVRTLGGSVGRIGQIVEGQATFAPGRASLVFLRPHVDPFTRATSDAFVVVDGAQGQFAIEEGGGRPPRLVRAANVGALLEPPSKAPGARFARDVLENRPLEDAAPEIAALWGHTH